MNIEVTIAITIKIDSMITEEMTIGETTTETKTTEGTITREMITKMMIKETTDMVKLTTGMFIYLFILFQTGKIDQGNMKVSGIKIKVILIFWQTKANKN